MTSPISFQKREYQLCYGISSGGFPRKEYGWVRRRVEKSLGGVFRRPDFPGIRTQRAE